MYIEEGAREFSQVPGVYRGEELIGVCIMQKVQASTILSNVILVGIEKFHGSD